MTTFIMYVAVVGFHPKMNNAACTCTSLDLSEYKICYVEPFLEGSNENIVKLFDIKEKGTQGRVRIACSKGLPNIELPPEFKLKKRTK